MTEIESYELFQPNEHIKIVYLQLRCKGCGLCVDACKLRVLDLSQTKFSEKGYALLEITNPDHCVGCARCELACPDFAIYVLRERKPGDKIEPE